jgi:hypothetical protein
MRRLIEYVAMSLVDDPSAVQVREVRNDRNVLALELARSLAVRDVWRKLCVRYYAQVARAKVATRPWRLTSLPAKCGAWCVR